MVHAECRRRQSPAFRVIDLCARGDKGLTSRHRGGETSARRQYFWSNHERYGAKMWELSFLVSSKQAEDIYQNAARRLPSVSTNRNDNIR